MKIKYEFANEVVEVEVDEKWAEIVMELDRCDYNNDHRETRRHSGYGTFGDEAGWLTTEKPETYIWIAGQTISPDDKRFIKAVRTLTDKQKELFVAVYCNGMSIKEYALAYGIDAKAASKRNRALIKKIKKFFE